MLRGSLVAIVSPMHEDGSLDLEAFRRLIDWHIARGHRRHRRGGHHRRVAHRRLRRALPAHQDRDRAARPAACRSSPAPAPTPRARPSSCRPSPTRPAPIMMLVGGALLQQAHPGRPVPALPCDRRGGRHTDDHVQRAVPHGVPTCTTTPRCAWLRFPTSSASRMRPPTSSAGADLIRRAPRGFAIYSGDDATALALTLMGGDGVISVTANAAPRLMHEMCAAAFGGDLQRARSANNRLLGSAPPPVRGGQPDPREVGAAADGADPRRHPPAVDAVVFFLPRPVARGHGAGGADCAAASAGLTASALPGRTP